MRIVTTAIAVPSILAAILITTGNAQARCGKNAIGTARSISIPGSNGPHYGRSHAGRRLPLRRKEVVLTFDDGPLGSKTLSVLRTLRKHCARAMFFPVGRMVANNPRMIRRIIRAGHTVGSHTMTHKNLGKIPYRKAVNEIYRGFAVTARASGGTIPPFFRFPGFNATPQLKQLLRRNNIATFSTDVDSMDWKGLKKDEMAGNLLKQLRARRQRGIILFHDINSTTVRALDTILTTLKRHGYRVVHVRPRRRIGLKHIRRLKTSSRRMSRAR